ncbi:hypothetical protein M413DRAFT_23222 [Hebeloma cylindrosporum]|uniref:DUF6534 domain-containing protein n=1 Tax=Hebeloma cylindrosporum TaxID=76867 RepID=A0A0C3CSK1_HEBCY|nr:hypothetical protein M413DRAFT_23222 [Hebeloma cylindrosporum h7]
MVAKVTLDNTLGAAFLGMCASSILIGIAIVQTHLYYRTYPRDWMYQKVAVGVLLAVAIPHMVFAMHAVYFYIIINFGNPRGLQTVIWSFKVQVIFNTLTVIFVQGLYAVRVWKRNEVGSHFSRILPAAVVLIVAGGWAVGLLATVESFKQKDFTNIDSMKTVLKLIFGTATCVDLIIAGAMCYYLYQSRTTFVGTNNKIFTVMQYVLITGCLTSLSSLCTLLLYATMPDNLVWIGMDLLLPNIYLNSYLAMLNARKSMNEKEASGSDVSNALNNIRSGTAIRTDLGNIHSVDDKMSPDGIPLSARFTPGFSKQYELEQPIPSKHVGV